MSDYPTRFDADPEGRRRSARRHRGRRAHHSLGSWQTRRGDEKALRQAQWDEALARAPTPIASREDAAGVARKLPQRVELNGAFVPEATVYIDNRLVDGVAGYQVVTPVAVADGMPWILVNRGWAPRNMADRTRLPAAPIGGGPLRVEGVAVEHLPRMLELGERGGPLARHLAEPGLRRIRAGERPQGRALRGAADERYGRWTAPGVAAARCRRRQAPRLLPSSGTRSPR